MQRLLVVLVLALSVAPAYAQAIESPRKLESMSQRDREREAQQQQWQGPSGFWTSPHKSEHGAYRYRLLGIGGAVFLFTGLLVWRLIRGSRK